MSQTLILKLSDEAYSVICRQAETAGTSPARWITTILEQRYQGDHEGPDSHARQPETEQQAARERFERHFGAVDLGYPTGADNEQIDADLAREYVATHEDN